MSNSDVPKNPAKKFRGASTSEEPPETPQDPILEMPLSRVSTSPTKNSQTSTSQEPRENFQDHILPTGIEMPLSRVSTSPWKDSQASTSQEPRETPQNLLDPQKTNPVSFESVPTTRSSLPQPQRIVLSQQPRNDWNPKMWEWDSQRFEAKPVDAESLRLENSGFNVVEDTPFIISPNKKARSGSPGSGGGNYPKCQVDNCTEDLSPGDNDYYRNYKVCQVHSKATTALVDQQIQRFCKHCKRFHLLSAFDGGERTCRYVNSAFQWLLNSGGGNYPKCQVDNCNEDLSLGIVEYYRKCKVCAVHYKATTALVEQQIQRFCQYCQRFHLLSAFDEGQRICRRGLSEFFPLGQGERASNSSHSPSQDSDSTTKGQDSRYSLSQKLVTSSPEHESRPTVASASCNLVDDISRTVQDLVKQDRTREIAFKLLVKDPSQLPGTLRTEIHSWLYSMPSELESYIKPGCVILSVYVAMSASAWEQLEENLLQRVGSLVQDSDFWSNTRFLVNTGRQLASYKNGRIRLSKSWRTSNSPELITVSPLAVVAGEETTLVVRGRNLTNDGMSFRCAHMGKYALMEVTGAEHRGTKFDELNVSSFKVESASPGSLGRCFIQVENGFRCDSFPLIIANAKICKELNRLEDEFHRKDMTEEHREEVLYFLNELGWLFQRIQTSEFSLLRFKFLLVCSVERGYCSLVKTLLDMMVERNLGEDGLMNKESLDMLADIQLLNRAVKSRNTKMVETLIHYPINPITKNFIFLPNTAGPGDIIPLHLAASTYGSDDMIDVLTNDPNKIGLSCWNSLIDASGQTPFSYAAMRNNHSYNTLVTRKVADLAIPW